MTKISEATFNELKETFDKAIQEAFGAGKKSAERESQMDAIKVGDNVRFFGGDDKYEFLTEGSFYEVLEKTTHPHENIPVLRIEDNRRRADECSLIRPDTVHLFEVVEETPVIGPPWAPAPPLTPNQQRYETNQQAREFVEKHTKYNSEASAGKGVGIGYIVCIPEFIINKEKRAVTVLFKHVGDRTTVRRKGIAKFMPGDVFNEWIGKAIALARALEIDIPQEFLDAVQPTETVLGMVVNYRDSIREISETLIFGETCHLGSDTGKYGTIIDDTNAEYGHGE